VLPVLRKNTIICYCERRGNFEFSLRFFSILSFFVTNTNSKLKLCFLLDLLGMKCALLIGAEHCGYREVMLSY